jgi:urea transport system permease protein
MTTAFLEALFNGLSTGSILILTALGLSITFGVMGVINMAHGEMLMLGAYTGYVVTDPDGLPRMLRGIERLTGLPVHISSGFEGSIYFAVPLAFAAAAAVGYVLERGLIRFLYGRPLDTLLATWGVGLVLQQVMRLLFGADLKKLDTPEFLTDSWEFAGATFPRFRVFIIAAAVICLLAVYLCFYRTSLGLQIRAVTQNRSMASALGIPTHRIDALTFAFGTGLAGAAGCIVAHMYPVTPNMGSDYIVAAFMVVILGGMGQLTGTIAGGLVIGIATGFAEKLYGNSLISGLFPANIQEVNQQMAMVSVLLLVIAFIMVRPSGLFAVRERVYD